MACAKAGALVGGGVLRAGDNASQVGNQAQVTGVGTRQADGPFADLLDFGKLAGLGKPGGVTKRQRQGGGVVGQLAVADDAPVDVFQLEQRVLVGRLDHPAAHQLGFAVAGLAQPIQLFLERIPNLRLEHLDGLQVAGLDIAGIGPFQPGEQSRGGRFQEAAHLFDQLAVIVQGGEMAVARGAVALEELAVAPVDNGQLSAPGVPVEVLGLDVVPEDAVDFHSVHIKGALVDALEQSQQGAESAEQDALRHVAAFGQGLQEALLGRAVGKHVGAAETAHVRGASEEGQVETARALDDDKEAFAEGCAGLALIEQIGHANGEIGVHF